ncbi:ATP-binding protein [Paraliomyxa miuraensis]|uniref:ATP-binding protein n=1 Tax=Paraliomyxa miuraensis TaxID=376150 RepID=UPI002251171B|nr:ATP-binding protein [Paraliomyxa miuraensis]MCX4239473.1 ATP-binding protein [Paraliomyxa miuraensis]
MTADPSLKQTKVDLAGLMKVLGEHLYSSPNVAIRELVQNAHDSCVRREVESSLPFEPRIEVSTDANAHTLSFEDTGAGLTDEEIERYLATIGSGYTRTLRDSGHEGLIGYFGLGFLSAFVISERIEVWTCSYQDPERAWSFSSRSGQSYVIQPAPARPVGTRVTLHLASRFEELSRARPVRALLERYCGLLQVPIHCGEGPAVNATPPPWRRDEPEPNPVRRRREALEVVRRFEPGFEPLCTLPVRSTPDDAVDVRGLLWIQDGATYGTSDNRNVSVFVRGMLINDDERDLLPAWAGFCGAVIESDALQPTASRESLQKDPTYQAVQACVRESLIEGLRGLASEQPAAWRTVLRRHNEALLGAALCDARLFDLLCDELTVPTSQGDLAVATVLQRSGGRLHVSQADRGGFEELLFRALKVPVVQGVRYGALPFCRTYAERRHGRLVMVGTQGGDRELFRRQTLPQDQTERLQAWFGGDSAEVVPASFAPEHLPLVVVPDREAELKQRIESDEADKRIASAVLGLARQFTGTLVERPLLRVYVNLGCEVIPALLDATPERAEAALALLRPLLGLLSEPEGDRPLMPIDEALAGYCRAVTQIARGEA